MSKQYVCTELVGNVCTKWVELNSPSLVDYFNQLSMAQVWQIFSATALLFAVSWVFREIPFFTKQR